MEALASDVTIDRLVISKDVKDAGGQKLIDDAKSRGIKIMFMDKAALDRESTTGKHQGFIAMTTDYKYSTIEEILALAKERQEDPFVIILDGVEDPHNLGSVIRVAECCGAHGLIIGRHRAVNVNETVIRVSSGASAHIKIARVAGINGAIDQLKGAGLWVIGADMGGDSMYKVNLKGALALVIGGEGKGISRLTKEKCDALASIDMFGKVNSLNASVACGVIAYEAIRQRKS